MSGRKSDTEETSKQKKLNRGNCLGSDPTLPTTSEKGQKYLYYFYNHSFFFFPLFFFFFLALFFPNFFFKLLSLLFLL